MRGFGYEYGKPVVRDLSRGRAFFGFDRSSVDRAARRSGHRKKAQQYCEEGLAAGLDAAIAGER